MGDEQREKEQERVRGNKENMSDEQREREQERACFLSCLQEEIN